MAAMETISVTLPAEMVAALREAVADGEYVSSNEAVSDALQGWSARRHAGEEFSEIKQAWQQAVERGGPYVPVDEVFDRLEAEFAVTPEAAAAK